MSNQLNFSHSHFAAACDAFKAAHNISQLERELGMTRGLLHNKFNKACENHKLTAVDLIALYRVSGDDTLLDGLLFDCSLTAVRLPSPEITIAPETRAQQALDASARIMGVTAQATQVLSSGRITKGHRNALVGGLMAGIEHMVLLATEVEQKFNSIPTLACAADIARASLGA
ncbi:phage regulatory CII family protein [Aeromonas enteropelogenes]|uniref:phage regulatory CII family protein n=1 Tax=Aeromonas enteropelogenes TaxID=29489 RepID=UPI0039868A6C